MSNLRYLNSSDFPPEPNGDDLIDKFGRVLRIHQT
ncbi:hypothetical protein AALP_AAs60910U000200 [Arabis alpina]|uniref:Uncharacterized protein n=1 Tax=Arabis alpina TaxID=50452 RepID=A0A087FYF3_ARAAL|nr:hypothetical protein AALP_AAs60910U000200 [Arabis alpina]